MASASMAGLKNTAGAGGQGGGSHRLSAHQPVFGDARGTWMNGAGISAVGNRGGGSGAAGVPPQFGDAGRNTGPFPVRRDAGGST